MDIVSTQVWAAPNLHKRPEKFVILDVLTKDGSGQYAAYRCIADEKFPREDWFLDRCAARGSKLRFIEAKASFPGLNEKIYRR